MAVVAVDWSTETAAVASMQQSCQAWWRRWRWLSRRRRRQWRRCSGAVESGGGGGSGSVDRVGGSSGVDAVELLGLVPPAVVAQSTETAAVASMQWSCRVRRQWWWWISRQRRRQWHRRSGADESGGGGSGYVDRDRGSDVNVESGGGGGGGSVDTDGGSGVDAVELCRVWQRRRRWLS